MAWLPHLRTDLPLRNLAVNRSSPEHRAESIVTHSQIPDPENFCARVSRRAFNTTCALKSFYDGAFPRGHETQTPLKPVLVSIPTRGCTTAAFSPSTRAAAASSTSAKYRGGLTAEDIPALRKSLRADVGAAALQGRLDSHRTGRLGIAAYICRPTRLLYAEVIIPLALPGTTPGPFPLKCRKNSGRDAAWK